MCEHVVPQAIPAGALETVPPVDFVTVSVCFVGRLNVAMTVRAWLIVTTQLPVPVHAPDQPANTDPTAGVAVSVTTVPVENDALHPGLQAMPEGLDVTAPDPLPAVNTSSSCPAEIVHVLEAPTGSTSLGTSSS